MFNFNIFASLFKNLKQQKKCENIDQYKFMRKMMYVKMKYPNCPNSDYLKLMEKNDN